MYELEGQRLGEAVAVVVFTFPVDDREREVGMPLLATVSDGKARAIFWPNQFKSFLATHRKSWLACHDTGRLHWIFYEHFVGARDTAAVESLWEFSRSGRLIDVELLDDLVGIGQGAAYNAERTLESLVRRHCQREVPSYEDVEKSLFRAARDGASGQLDAGLREDAITIADATLAVFEVLWQEACRIAREHGIDGSTIEQYGPLGLRLQVQGAVALRRAAQLGFRLNEEAVDRVISILEWERQRYAQELMRNRDAGQCFRSDRGNMRFRDEMPDANMKRLRRWLDGLHSTFRGPDGVPLPLRIIAEDAKPTAVPEVWRSIRMGNRSLWNWSRLLTVSKNLRFLRLKRRVVVRPKYFVLERISSVEPDKESLHDLLNRNILLDRNGRPLILGRFQDLELRALAAICRWRYGQSRLAELFEEDIDVYQLVAETLAESGLGDTGAISSQTIEGLEPWKKVARAHFLAIGLKLGDELASRIVRHAYDVPLAAAAAPRITARILDLFPELREYGRDDTIEILARKLGAESEVRQWWEDVSGRNVTTAEIRQAICGYKINYRKRGLARDIVLLSQDSDLRELLLRQTYGPDVSQAILAEARVTPTGRVRGPELFWEGAAEYLDLADDAVKAALFALVTAGFDLCGYAAFTFAVEVRTDSEVDSQAAEAVRVAAVAAESVLGLPVECTRQTASTW